MTSGKILLIAMIVVAVLILIKIITWAFPFIFWACFLLLLGYGIAWVAKRGR
jgi:hypothetical protein